MKEEELKSKSPILWFFAKVAGYMLAIFVVIFIITFACALGIMAFKFLGFILSRTF